MADPLEEVELPEGRALVLATVQGLVAEAEAVKAAWPRKPDAVALNVSAEGVAGLRKALTEGPQPIGVRGWSEEEGEEYDAVDALGDAEIAYGLALERYGSVRLPPPDLMEAARLATEADVPLFGVDFSEDQYEERFLRDVGILSVWRYDRRAKRLSRQPPSPGSAREFAIAWDRELTTVKGYATLETARERRIAEATAKIAARYGTVLLVVDVARRDGVLRHLRETKAR